MRKPIPDSPLRTAVDGGERLASQVSLSPPSPFLPDPDCSAQGAFSQRLSSRTVCLGARESAVLFGATMPDDFLERWHRLAHEMYCFSVEQRGEKMFIFRIEQP
jgi:hypothetical protein